MADNHYEHGSMDIETQEKTFDGFMRWVVNAVIVIFVVLIFLLVFAS